jgi:pimeloyl-ACP methyl ester carboxylesterase
MPTETAQMIDVSGRAIAVLDAPVAGTTGLFWMPGFRSDMVSTKATELAVRARGRRSMTRFDYMGHGQSSGRFDDATIGTWLEDATAVFTRVTAGPQVIIGSSMGGYLALLLLRRLIEQAPAHAARIKALILIAPAWDMTEELMWKAFTPYQQASLMAEGHYLRPSDYGEPYKITRGLIEEGRTHLLKGHPFDPGRPIHILQGLHDESVPAAHVRKLKKLLTGGHVTLEEIPDGDHRLSRPQDIERLCAVVEEMAG